ncbi:MAG: hypothetical protein K9L17_05955 [Clostridiales bacterium]|nr:hypothetical protein [Clostridiales bacterium]MCF8022216.1 hypothetical protein [Clostridiales bacterium]
MSGTESYERQHGMVLVDRLYNCIDRNVTVNLMDGTIIRGRLASVGRDYIEVRRQQDGSMQKVLIPLSSIRSIVGPATEMQMSDMS